LVAVLVKERLISEWVDGILDLVSSDLLKQEIERARLAEEMFRREEQRLKEVCFICTEKPFSQTKIIFKPNHFT
jgi:hypothetical protein